MYANTDRLRARARKAEVAAQSLSNPYGASLAERRAKHPATRRLRSPRPSPPHLPKRSAAAPLWPRLSYDQKMAWLAAINGAPHMPRWVEDFIHEIGLAGADHDHAPLTIAVLDMLVCATARELLGVAR